MSQAIFALVYGLVQIKILFKIYIYLFSDENLLNMKK